MWFVENYEDRIALSIKTKEKPVEEKSDYQRIEIYDTDYFGKLLVLDGLTMLTEKTEFVYHEMIAHPALCTHKNPENVLVVGGGDGGTIREILKHDSVKKAVLCEIDERVVRLCQEYFPTVAGQLDDPRVELVFQDGFQYLDQFEDYFDVIITDSTDPIGPGAKLFQEDYYRLVKKALRPDGVVVCQSESGWYYEKILTAVTQSLSHVFENVETYLAEVPLYPTAFTMTFASDAYSLQDYDQEKSLQIATSCKYYNPILHLGSLALPNFMKEFCGG